jgi:hypothetical protein
MMVDLQCVDFGVEGESRVETAEGRGGDMACILEVEERGQYSMEQR